VSNAFGLVIESLVAVLLLLTIGYCMLLNARLKRLKADEMVLKATIAELITATEIAERAIAGLKMTVRDCDSNLGERLRQAEQSTAELDERIGQAQEVLHRLGQIALAARPAAASEPQPPPDAQAIVKAAHDFAARTRARTFGAAA
jgi:hypothetical protein